MEKNVQTQNLHRLGLRPRERSLFLVLGDFMSALAALMVTLYFWANSGDEFLKLSVQFLIERPPIWFYLLPFGWLLLIIELYDNSRSGNLRATISGLLGATVVGFVLYSVVYFLPQDATVLPRRGVPVFLLMAMIVTMVWRMIFIRVSRTKILMRRVLVVGAGSACETLFEMIAELPQKPFEVIGIIDDDKGKLGSLVRGVEVMGSGDELLDTLANQNITDIIIAISGTMRTDLFQTLLRAQELGYEVSRMQIQYEDLLGRVAIFHQEPDWVLRTFVEQSRVTSFYRVSKRLIDIIGGLVGVLAVLIVLPFITIANLLESGLPIFYVQERSGRGDVPYGLVKFRTMRKDAEKDGVAQWTSKDDARITKVGRILRKTHLDEFPQFINILKGEMSLVGPRPERPELVTLFQEHVPFYRARLFVKPGLTGWAQIHQDYAANIDETNIKLEYDLYYIKHRSFWLDVMILLRTPATMLGFRGR